MSDNLSGLFEEHIERDFEGRRSHNYTVRASSNIEAGINLLKCALKSLTLMIRKELLKAIQGMIPDSPIFLTKFP
jgi:hypothetical protein